MNMGQFRSLVQAATGVKHTHRYLLQDKVITNNATTAFPLLTTDDDPDYDEDFDGSSAAPECEPGSRILGIDITLDLVPGNAGGQHMWMIYKDPDSLLGAVPATPAMLFTNDLTANNILVRKYAMAFGRFLSTATKESSRSRVQISRAAMRRAGVMKENDVLRFVVTATDTTSDGTLSLHGRIWTRK